MIRWDRHGCDVLWIVALILIVCSVVGGGIASGQPVRPVVNISTTTPGTIGPAPCPGLSPSNTPATATLRRTGDVSTQLAVSYTFGAGSSTATFAVGETTTVLSFQTSGTLALINGPNYDLGDPSSADILVVPPPGFPCLVMALTDAGSNSAQTIRLGQAPVALIFENVVPVSVAGGALPRGLTLNTDGTWSGTAQEVGTFELTLQFCQPNCVTSQLMLIVEPRDNALARTGSESTTWCVAALLLIVCGAWLRRGAARHMTR